MPAWEQQVPRIVFMDRETQCAIELQALRALCDGATPSEDRQRLVQSLTSRAFVEPENQVVFESIRALLARAPISVAQLRVHLNNRGFPDTDVEKYFQAAPSRPSTSQATDKVTP